MDKKDLLKAIGEVDESLVREAAPKKINEAAEGSSVSSGTVKKFRQWAGLAVAACLLIAFFAIGLPLLKREPVKTPDFSGGAQASDTESIDAMKTSDTDSTDAIRESETLTPASSAAPAATTTTEPRIFYQKDGVTVSERSGKRSTDNSVTEYCLDYLTEEELFTRPLVLRAVLTGIQPLEISQILPDGTERISFVSVLSFEVVSVLNGSLPEGQSIVKVWADRHVGTSLEGLSLSLDGAVKEQEGIIMLYEMEDWYPEYMKQMADFTPGDNQRFAVWEVPGIGLSFSKTDFYNVDPDWNLDQVEAYARSVIEDDEPAPADFALTLRRMYYGIVPEDNSARYYDSAGGIYSERGSYHEEKKYGAEALETTVIPEREILDQIYNVLKRVSDLPEMLSETDHAGEPDSSLLELSWVANGETHRIFWAGKEKQSREAQRLSSALIEVLHYLHSSQDYRAWQDKLSKIDSAKNRARSEEILAVMWAVFEEKYGPGGTPDYFRKAEIIEGGYLQVWLYPCNDETVKAFQSLLPEGYEVWLFAEDAVSTDPSNQSTAEIDGNRKRLSEMNDEELHQFLEEYVYAGHEDEESKQGMFTLLKTFLSSFDANGVTLIPLSYTPYHVWSDHIDAGIEKYYAGAIEKRSLPGSYQEPSFFSMTVSPYDPAYVDFEEISILNAEDIYKLLSEKEYTEVQMTDETPVMKLTFDGGMMFFVKADIETKEIHGVCIPGLNGRKEYSGPDEALWEALKGILDLMIVKEAAE